MGPADSSAPHGQPPSTASPPPDPRVGHVLQGRYRIISKVASGAMGVVYRAERLQLGRAVAIKFLHPWIAAQKAFLGRFENEAKAMSRLTHPHCVSVIDFGVDGSPYLVMDFVTGHTLRDAMRGGRLQVTRVLSLMQQLLAGLAHAHAQGIIHRDLKPDNLILSDEEGLDEHLRILDFGLAKLRDGPAMTAGLAVGTPSYMSPEQSGGDGAIDARTDIYSVGVILFEVLSGRKPFQGDNVGEVILAHREAPPPRLSVVVPDAGYSAAIDDVIVKALAKRPEDRFQTAAALAAALEVTPEAVNAAAAGRTRAPAATSGSAAPDATVVDRVAPRGTAATADAPWRLFSIVAGFLLLALLALWIGRTLRHPDGEAQRESPAAGGVAASPPANAATPPPASPPPAVPERPQIEEARQLVASGQTEQAIALLTQLRAAQPRNADAAYLLAVVCFDDHRWAQGLSAAEVAAQTDPTLKRDPDLINGVLRSLENDRGYRRSQALLRSMGAPAVAFIKTAAQHDPHPKVRVRAAEILAGGGGRAARSAAEGPRRGWQIPSSSSPSSSGSLFKR